MESLVVYQLDFLRQLWPCRAPTGTAGHSRSLLSPGKGGPRALHGVNSWLSNPPRAFPEVAGGTFAEVPHQHHLSASSVESLMSCFGQLGEFGQILLLCNYHRTFKAARDLQDHPVPPSPPLNQIPSATSRHL